MIWTRTEENKYECNTNNWHFIIETNSEGNNILSSITHFKNLENSKRILLIKDDVRECFHYAFDLNLLTERRIDESK